MTEMYRLKAPTGSLVCSLQKVMSHSVENQRDPGKTLKTVAVSDFYPKMLMEKGPSFSD